MECAPDYSQNARMAETFSGIDPKAVGLRIKAVREALGMKSADFGRLVGLTSQALANYENGHRRPDLDQAFKNH